MTPGGTSEAPGTVAAHCEAASRRQLVRVVGHRPGPGRHHQGAVRRPRRHGGRDHPPRPRHAPGPGRGGRRRRRGRGARRRRHPQRGGQRPGRHRHRAGPAARRLDQRVRPHPRPARRPHRGHRRAARRAGPRLDAPGRARLGERPLLPLPRRHRLRRRGGERGRAARLAQALRQPPPLRLGRVRHLAAPLRPPQPALLGEGARRGDRRRRPVHGVPQHQPVHVHRHPAVQRRPRGRPRPGPGRGDGAQPRRPSPARHPRPPRSGRAAACAATATSPTAPT